MTSTGRLFELEPEPAVDVPDGSVPVRVLPDVSGFDKEFDYLLTGEQVGLASIGDQVRIELKGRQVSGWITGIDLDRPSGITLRPVSKITSAGPSSDIVEVARWAARRWGGRMATVLKTASPPRRVLPFPATPAPSAPPPAGGARPGVEVFRFGPAHDLLPLLIDAAGRGNAIVVVPGLSTARALAGRLRRHKVAARVHPRDWGQGAHRGGVVIGARSAVWARVPDLATIVVIDEHDEALQEERNPTWHARDVAIERARRGGAACWLVSPSPSVVALNRADQYHEPGRSAERADWPIVETVDRRDDEPGRGLFSAQVVDAVRQPGSVLCVLNRKGRAVMLACSQCGELVLTEDGERLMVEQEGHLVCPSTGETRPIVCANCGATRLKRLRLGVARAAEELAALAGEPVDELSGPGRSRQGPGSRVVVGTEAALHQLTTVDRVVFLDFDQELLAPRYRAGEQAMSLLILAARLVGGRANASRAGGGGIPGRIVIQTRTPKHRVLSAAVKADPASFARAELDLRQSLELPPFAALAELSGKGAPDLGAALAERAGIDVMGPRHDGRYLVKASSADELADALADTPRPEQQRVRVAVDPPRA
ncbi:MAG: hypothetical protein GY724_16245 [Actinomycetia bacterium]|nr:hypothetical protein [Actinomycetes bacterium]MCP4226493.1 hypothetical protein [Actinomycetes bacterium]MCP5034588.1 hypothetical protein [Actinomycetes bacterium]